MEFQVSWLQTTKHYNTWNSLDDIVLFFKAFTILQFINALELYCHSSSVALLSSTQVFMNQKQNFSILLFCSYKNKKTVLCNKSTHKISSAISVHWVHTSISDAIHQIQNTISVQQELVKSYVFALSAH